MPQPVQHQQVRPHHHPRSTSAQQSSLERHRRKCSICNHPDREEIEERFTHWRNLGSIVEDFHLDDIRVIYRHAHATGLYEQRRRNYLFTIENILECGEDIELTASAYIKAVRAYACLCDTVRWNEPATRVHHDYHVHTDSSGHGDPVPHPRHNNQSRESSSGTDSLAVPSSSLPQAAVDSPARSAVRSSQATSHRPRVSSVRQAKNYLRVSGSPEFLRSTPNLQRHRRKCAICRHPEREMIEELFVCWHSPQAIANHLEDWDNVNWVSIYRHAYAFGLDAVRRRNLRHFFENLLDDAINATPTFAGVLGAARALGCVTEDGRWVEPEKRILMTTLVRHEEPASTTTTEPDVSSAPPEQDVAPFASSLPQPAVNPSARSATCGSGLQLRQKARLKDASIRERPKGRGSASTPSLATCDSPVTNCEPQVAPSSLLPQAAFDQPADASQTPPSGQPSTARRNESVAVTATALPGTAPHQPAAAKRTPSDVPDPTSLPPCFLASSSSREIRLPLNSHKSKEKPISNR